MIKKVYVNCTKLDFSRRVTPEPVLEALHRTNKQKEETWQKHFTYQTETTILRHIKNGEPEKMADFFYSKGQTAYWHGDFSGSDIKQAQTLFIVSVTLFTRYAIEGGLGEELAYDLSDCYINYVNTLNDLMQVMQVCANCAIDYAQRVKEAKVQLSLPVKQCRDYVRDHMWEKTTVADLAQCCSRTPEHLAKLFRKELGLTPKEYILQEKLQAARDALMTTNSSVSAIAQRFGFGTHSSFSQHFKKAYGMSPSEYRMSKQNTVWEAN